MTHKPLLVSIAAFLVAVVLALGGALILVGVIERRTESSLNAAFAEAGLSWVQVVPDGVQVHLSGTAPDESTRIRVLRVAGDVIDTSRMSEDIVVTTSTASVAPVFRIEMMRDHEAVSVIGLVPQIADGGPILGRLEAQLPGAEIADMLQSADHAVPGGWVNAVDFAVRGLAVFEVGRISVTAGRIEVEALVSGPEERTRLEAQLRALAPRGQVLALELTAPRPVATPFLLRVDAEDGVVRLGACSADTEEAQMQIQAALRAAGLNGRVNCPQALGAPSPRWGEAAAAAIRAVSDLRTGSLTLSDGDVVLTVPHTVAAADFDRIVGRLETALPEAFSVSARRLEPPVVDEQGTDGRAEVSMVLTDEGRLTISGRLPDARIRSAVEAFARARFGAQAVDLAARVDDGLPQGWSVRVLTALEALAELHHGAVVVHADKIEVTGVSGNPDVSGQVTQAIVQGLGPDAEFALDITYDALLDPVAQAPTPDNCERRINTILTETKITFDAGSVVINTQAGQVIDAIAEVLRECGEMPFEVGGYTDSQGREETNLALSQARADAVVNALLARRVLVSSLVARGYGAADPIADNGTEAGREANRRIAFTLIRPPAPPEPLDPALEAQLVFEIRTPDANTTRPMPRPLAQAAEEDVVDDLEENN